MHLVDYFFALHSQKKRYKSCHWGCTFSKGKLLSILGANMHILCDDMYILGANMYILSVSRRDIHKHNHNTPKQIYFYQSMFFLFSLLHVSS